MKNLIYTILVIGCMPISCQYTSHNKDIVPNNITFIFEQTPKQRKFITPSGFQHFKDTAYLLSYLDHNILREYSPTRELDTLVISCVNNFLEINFYTYGDECFPIFFRQGDTIQVQFDSLAYPIFSSYSSNELSTTYNFLFNIKDRQVHWGLEALTCLKDYSAYLRRVSDLLQSPLFSSDIKQRWRLDYISIDSLQNAFHQYVINYREALDHLKLSPEIAEPYLNYFNYLLQIKMQQFTLSDYLFGDPQPADTTIYHLLSDSLIHYISYHTFVQRDLTQFENKSKNIPYIGVSGGSFLDWRRSFDSIWQEPRIPLETKKIALRYCLDKIVNYFAFSDIKNYLERYQSITNDSLYVAQIVNKHRLDFSTNDQLLLTTPEGLNTDFQMVLSKNIGKVIYVDFWASWCAPCREEMPAAKELREAYRTKDVVFIYLALNDQEQAWRQALSQVQIEREPESFLITNPKTSQFLIDLEVKGIPRYLIYDKNGMLVHRNAPRPGSSEIRTILNQYVNE